MKPHFPPIRRIRTAAFRALLCSLVLTGCMTAKAVAPADERGTTGAEAAISEADLSGAVLAAAEFPTEREEASGEEVEVSPETSPAEGEPETSLPEEEGFRAPASEPLKITFPNVNPAPVSAWRPPLYPTPWALSQYDHFYFSRPIAADEVNWPLWDYRYGGSIFEGVVHTGIDITAPKGTPVLAAGPGEVIWAGYGLYYGVYNEDDPYGKAVAIHHEFGYAGQELYTVYGHMDRVDVVRGQQVEAGEVLGVSGMTGNATGPHLHFEVRVGNNSFYTTYNPELWLAPPTGWGLLAGRVTGTSGYANPGMEVHIRSLESTKKWMVKTYWDQTVHSDPYYQENMVIGDLPAGKYEVRIPYLGRNYFQEIEIFPGAVTYITFKGRLGFSLEPPDPPEFIPVE